MSDTPHNEGFFSRWGRRITSLRNFIVNAVFLLFLVVILSALLSTRINLKFPQTVRYSLRQQVPLSSKSPCPMIGGT